MKKIILLIALLLVFIPMKINALEHSFYEGEYIPNTYIKKFKGNSGKYEQMRVFRRNGDNRIVYCLQLWETMNSNKNITGYENRQANTLGIERLKWERISLLAYYGYGYYNHDDIKWYAITQFMIWQTLEEDSTIYFTDTLNGNRVDKYLNEMNELNNLVSNHFILPDINHSPYILYNHTYTYSDNNKVLDKYDVVGQAGITVEKMSDTIKVTNSNIGFSYFNLIKQDKMYSNPITAYIDNNGQNLLLPGSYEAINYIMCFNISKVNFIINKIGEDNLSLEGTTFEIYDNNHNYMMEKTVDENNQIVLNDIGEGIYYLKEIRTGKGYSLKDEIEVMVDSSHTSIDIINEVVKNKISINKFSKDKNDNITDEEAKFIIYNNKDEEVLSFITKNGHYETYLPYGTYTVKQISGKDNYKFVEDFEINIIEDEKVQEFNLYDEEITNEPNNIVEDKEIIEEIGDITNPNAEIEDQEIIYDVPNTFKNDSFNIINLFFILFIYSLP